MSGWCSAGAVGAPQQYTSDADCEACVDKTVSYKTVQFPCSQNVTRTVTKKVPRQVMRKTQVPVSYVENEQRAVVQPVTKYVNVTSYKDVAKQVPITKTRTVMKEKTRIQKVPTTKWVDVEVKFQEPYTQNYVEHETRYERRPFTTSKPVTENVTKYVNVPVTKQRLEERTHYETVMEERNEQVCAPVSRMCTTTVPVYKVVVRPPGQCNPRGAAPLRGAAPTTEGTFNKVDTNNDGVIDRGEFRRGVQRNQIKPVGSGNWQ